MHQLERAGADDLTQWEALPFAERRTKLAGRGVFTLANSEGDEFEVLPVIRAHDAEAAREVGASKVRKARYIAESYDCPPEVAQLLRDVSAYLDV
jgi:hypothetical protein